MPSNEQMAETVRSGGNLEGGYVFDPRSEPNVRKMTDAEAKLITDADKAAAKLANKIAAEQPVSGGVNVPG